MDLSKILSIAGKPGLFKMVGESKTGLVVESLLDGKRYPAFSHQRISSLQEISIYTYDEDMPLADIFKNIHNKTEGKALENPKKMSSDQLKEIFAEVVPEYDEDAVYTSDMKKVFSWYNLLLESNLLDFSEEEAESEDKTESADKEENKEENKDDNKGE